MAAAAEKLFTIFGRYSKNNALKIKLFTALFEFVHIPEILSGKVFDFDGTLVYPSMVSQLSIHMGWISLPDILQKHLQTFPPAHQKNESDDLNNTVYVTLVIDDVKQIYAHKRGDLF